jgi:hypothetical protein
LLFGGAKRQGDRLEDTVPGPLEPECLTDATRNLLRMDRALGSDNKGREETKLEFI